MSSTILACAAIFSQKWLRFAVSLRPRSSYLSASSPHRKYLGFWYIALEKVTSSSSNFSRSSRFIGTRTKSFGTCRRPQDRRGEGAAQEDQQEDQGRVRRQAARLGGGRRGRARVLPAPGDLQHRIKHEPTFIFAFVVMMVKTWAKIPCKIRNSFWQSNRIFMYQ